MGKTSYTKITPLPSNVPRQLALELLHSHAEVIQLNPLVTLVEDIEAPRDCSSEEYYSQWHRITEIITWGFGIKKKISFNGCFHDQPWGLQSHVYAPMGVDLRQKFRIGGNQPGEPREPKELGVDTPLDGLYLREDVEISCAIPGTAGFVKKEMKAATGVMIERLAKKAELLDEGKLHAMFENGKLKTARPSGNPTFAEKPLPSPSSSVSSPNLAPAGASSPLVDERGFGRYNDIVQTRDRPSGYLAAPGYGTSPQTQPIFEMAGSTQYVQHQGLGLHSPSPKPPHQQFRAELAGSEELTPRPLSSMHPGYGTSPGNTGYVAYHQGVARDRHASGSIHSSMSSSYQGPTDMEKPDPSSLGVHPAHRSPSASPDPQRFSQLSVSRN